MNHSNLPAHESTLFFVFICDLCEGLIKRIKKLFFVNNKVNKTNMAYILSALCAWHYTSSSA